MSKQKLLLYIFFALCLALLSSIFAYYANIGFPRHLTIYYVRAFARLSISTVLISIFMRKLKTKLASRLILSFCLLSTIASLVQILSAFGIIQVYIPSNLFNLSSQAPSLYRVRGLTPSLQGSGLITSMYAIYSFYVLNYRLSPKLFGMLPTKLYFLLAFFVSSAVSFLTSRTMFIGLTFAILLLFINITTNPDSHNKRTFNAMLYLASSVTLSSVLISFVVGWPKLQFIFSERYQSALTGLFISSTSSRTELDGSLSELIFDIWGRLSSFTDMQLLLGSACDRNSICGGSDPLYTSVLMGAGMIGLISVVSVFILCGYYSFKNKRQLGLILTIFATLLSFKTDIILSYYIYPVFIYLIANSQELLHDISTRSIKFRT